jgi:hypothetical protein
VFSDGVEITLLTPPAFAVVLVLLMLLVKFAVTLPPAWMTARYNPASNLRNHVQLVQKVESLLKVIFFAEDISISLDLGLTFCI